MVSSDDSSKTTAHIKSKRFGIQVHQAHISQQDIFSQGISKQINNAEKNVINTPQWFCGYLIAITVAIIIIIITITTSQVLSISLLCIISLSYQNKPMT